ncbi:hypothetical protein EDB84DRAFT_1657043 [Lactarius hengduanensis]|nr:hypothetical protein EDB84DRAFT_1657043 [Lactarius hengduanensis]
MASRGETTADMKRKIIQIPLVFCQVSQSDVHVCNALGTRKVVRRALLRACELLEPEYMLKGQAIKHLSMNAMLLEVLQSVNAIEILTRILDERSSGPLSTTCYSLCRLNKRRQAQAGIIPLLMRVIESSSPELPDVAMYIKLLTDPYFQVSSRVYSGMALEEIARAEDKLCLISAKADSFENLLDPFLKICRYSTPIAFGIAKAQVFRCVSEKLGNSKAVVKLNLLYILRAVCDVHQNRALLVEFYGIHEAVAALLRRDGEPSLRVPKSSTAPKRRATRRPASDTSDIGTPSPPPSTGSMDNPRVASAGTGLAVGTTRGLSPRLHVGDIPRQSSVGTGRRRAATKKNDSPSLFSGLVVTRSCYQCSDL